MMSFKEGRKLGKVQIRSGCHFGQVALRRSFKCIPLGSCCSVAQLCPAVSDHVECSTPGFPVHHQLPALAKLMSIGLMMPSNHLILCCPLLLMPSILPSITYLHNFSRDCVLQVLFSCLKYKQRLYQSLSIFSVSFSPCFILFSAFL